MLIPGTLGSKVINIKILLALAFLVPASAEADTVMDCIGEGAATGFPIRHEDIERTFILKMTESDANVVLTRIDGPLPFCLLGAKCRVVISNSAIEIDVRNIPNYDPVYVQTFSVDLDKKTFKARGGGLDGGWSVVGLCKVR